MARKIARRKRKYERQVVTSADKGFNSVINTDFVRDNSILFMGTGDLLPSFCDYVKLIASKGFDIIQVEFYDYLPLVYLFPKEVKKIFVHHELHFVRNENEYRLYKNALSTDILLLEKEKANELACLKNYDAVVTLTETDKNILLAQNLLANKIFVSPAITKTVECEYKKFTPANEIVFVGSGDHFPNADAMVWFCQEVLQKLKTLNFAIPNIYVTGHWNNNLVSVLKQFYPVIKFVGIVEDLQTFLNGKISIVPLRIGSGMRMKILDSIFAAAPIVTTSKGCEGLPMSNEENCLIADTAEDFAKAIIQISTNKELQQRIVVNAQNSETDMLNDAELYEKRLSVYKNLLNE